MLNYKRYKRVPVVNFPERTWPNKEIEKAPVWCSVDLRDGNQALVEPMVVEEKVEMFNLLVKLGFKEIEVGFPAASQIEYDFLRTLVDRKLIPDDVEVQVLVQCREHLIKRTFEALKGIKKAIVHIYNSTSTLQRDVVFHKDMDEIKDIAIVGTKMVQRYAAECDTKIRLEYSPESFTGTELDFALDICTAVQETWGATKENPIIINLPSTVEMNTPNVYADQIEYCCRNLKRRDSVIVSLHGHNDRGLSIAETEFGIMAGADRVEGTLFGNGERTGNADIVTLAMNLFTQGVDPKLDFSHIDEAVEIYERLTRMTVHPRHPYAGSLVYTAFSGSHQDAIRKGMERMKEHPDRWEVPYLHIDPKDVGRTYDPIVRINSQSGKGGVAFILEQNFGLYLPKAFQQHFSVVITKLSDVNHKDIEPQIIFDEFIKEYVNITEPIELVSYKEAATGNEDEVAVEAVIKDNGTEKTIAATGNGIVDAFSHALGKYTGTAFEIVNYSEHSMEYGTKSRAISYIQISTEKGGVSYGAGISSNITESSLRAVVSAANKMID